MYCISFFFFFQAEDGIRDSSVTGVQTCALPIPEQGVIRDFEEADHWRAATLVKPDGLARSPTISEPDRSTLCSRSFSSLASDAEPCSSSSSLASTLALSTAVK